MLLRPFFFALNIQALLSIPLYGKAVVSIDTSISFNANFGSYMVLQQQPAKACLCGTLGIGGTSARINITRSTTKISFSSQEKLVHNQLESFEVEAEVISIYPEGGLWKACLEPMEAGGDYTITVICRDCKKTTVSVIDHVTFGDVWYCGGQSNMALPMVHSLTRNITRDAILDGKYDNIRIHGMEGNMNPMQPWSSLKEAQTTTPVSKIQSGCTMSYLPGTNL